MRRCAKRKSIPRSIPAGDAVTMKFFRGRSSIPACRASLCSEKTSALTRPARRSEEHTSELQSRSDLVCRLLLEKKKNNADHPNRQADTKAGSRSRQRPVYRRILTLASRKLGRPQNGSTRSYHSELSLATWHAHA